MIRITKTTLEGTTTETIPNTRLDATTGEGSTAVYTTFSIHRRIPAAEAYVIVAQTPFMGRLEIEAV